MKIIQYLIIIIFLFSCKSIKEITYHETLLENQVLMFQGKSIKKTSTKAYKSFERLQKQNYKEARELSYTGHNNKYCVMLNIFENDLLTKRELKLRFENDSMFFKIINSLE